MDNLHIFLGATVADAATRPLHWVYNPKKLKSYIKGKKEIAFLKKNKSQFLFNKNWKSVWLQKDRTSYVQDINSN
jgi:hypothetical protein